MEFQLPARKCKGDMDAAVDIDGDANPNSQPSVKPMGLPVDEYFDLLTADDVDTVNFGRCLVY